MRTSLKGGTGLGLTKGDIVPKGEPGPEGDTGTAGPEGDSGPFGPLVLAGGVRHVVVLISTGLVL